ncbi:Pentatricopeptide repeat-containing protein [Apostasia shenzhenica]|uniref:Pentatricopeptide repeat-containing protein n=1 Tax=Apostasia shenzhenica TaxID=1088818 RepID=A0A2I0AJ31_9ASPA|nr:Pentatricopeptide repeat-containing protein [Apostasia shenzhenica]
MAAAAAANFSRPCAPLIPPTENSLQILRFLAAGDLLKAVAALLSLPSADPAAYAAVLHACAGRRLLPLGRSLHRHLFNFSFSDLINLFLSNHLINMYCKCGRTGLARHLFDKMPQRNLVSWTALLTGYSQTNQHQLCFQLFSSMLAHHIPNEFGIVAVLSSSAGARHGLCGQQVHALVSKILFNTNVFVGNSLITMYSSCNGLEGDAWLVFETMPCRNLVTWNSMIAGFLRVGKWRMSLDLFVKMRNSSLEFDSATLTSVISSCSRIEQCLQLHCLCIKTSFDSKAEIATALVKTYSCLGGDFRDCCGVFSAITTHDIMSWTGIMTSFCEQNPAEAVSLFCQLRHDGFRPDRYTFSIVVKASASFATELHSMAFHSLILKSGYGSDTVLCNALIHSYARCGNIELAVCIFHEMELPDKVSWNSMIKAFAAHGKVKEALRTFRSMDVLPDSATFVGVLTACSHGGLVNEGCNVFKEMSEVYGIEPELDHFACMVDILGRAGKLLEAEELIKQMPMKPDSVVWSAMLGACRKHGNPKLGKKAAQWLMELEPMNSVGYVMLSNIYCATRSYRDAAFVRKGMKVLGVKKEPGLSWIEAGNRLHEFSVGGHHHPHREEIIVELKSLVVKLKEMGYVVDLRLVLHEIDEEHMEEQLLLHSEKMALVFGLMNASSKWVPIKIMKNIRICEDCHSFIKLASKYTGRDIVVRDSNRFHHFANGVCSCNDYW